MKNMLAMFLMLSFGVAMIGCQRDTEEAPADVPSPTGPQAPRAEDAPKADTPDARARALLDQASEQISMANYSEAEKTLQQLEGMKRTVSADMQVEIDNMQSTYKASRLIQEGR